MSMAVISEAFKLLASEKGIKALTELKNFQTTLKETYEMGGFQEGQAFLNKFSNIGISLEAFNIFFSLLREQTTQSSVDLFNALMEAMQKPATQEFLNLFGGFLNFIINHITELVNVFNAASDMMSNSAQANPENFKTLQGFFIDFDKFINTITGKAAIASEAFDIVTKFFNLFTNVKEGWVGKDDIIRQIKYELGELWKFLENVLTKIVSWVEKFVGINQTIQDQIDKFENRISMPFKIPEPSDLYQNLFGGKII